MDLFDDIIKKHGSGVKINLFVTPNAEKCVFPAGYNKWRKRMEIKLCSKAKDNQANSEVVQIIAEFFKKPIVNVYIVSGKKTRKKTVLINNISEKIAFQMLKESLNGL